jgi:hypothetical protein
MRELLILIEPKFFTPQGYEQSLQLGNSGGRAVTSAMQNFRRILNIPLNGIKSQGHRSKRL